MEAWMFCEPLFHAFGFVRTIVVNDKMQVNAGRCFSIDLLEKLKELILAVFRHTGPDYLTVKDIKRGKEGCRSLSFVIMSHSTGMAFLYG